MNERIRELAEQAGYTTDMFGVGHWDMPECKKFAELIVRECMEVVAKKCASPTAYNALAEHFGVEE
jgi:hypothetical protein